MTDDKLIHAYNKAIRDYEAAKDGDGCRVEAFTNFMVAEKVLTATAEQWFEKLGSLDCCVTPVRNVKDARADYPADPIPMLSETPGRAQGRAPKLGEHNTELL